MNGNTDKISKQISLFSIVIITLLLFLSLQIHFLKQTTERSLERTEYILNYAVLADSFIVDWSARKDSMIVEKLFEIERRR